MKRIVFIVCFLMATVCASAQMLSMSRTNVEEGAAKDHADASTYSKEYDQNDNLCALLKVTTPLKDLIVECGSMAVVKRVVKDNGEIWFYMPAEVKNLELKCAGYTPIPSFPVKLERGRAYLLTVSADRVDVVVNAEIKSDYLKMQVSPADALVEIGKTKNYELVSEILTDGNLAKKLDYGKYYYRVRHNMYETEAGEIVVSKKGDNKKEVMLRPAYSYLSITSEPEQGVDIWINDEYIGKTPLQYGEKIKRGTCSVRAQKKDFYTKQMEVKVGGLGDTQAVVVDMKPQFAYVTCFTDDTEAEIWVDQEQKGIGSWSGRLNSGVTHILEARKPSHQSQSISFKVKDGETIQKKVGAPIPLYASINVESAPLYCTVKIDGKEVGESPLVKQLLIGEHTVTVSKSGYISQTEKVTLKKGDDRTLRFELKKGQIYAPVVLTTDSESEIYVNDQYKGKGQWSGKLPEGEYTVRSVKSNHDDGQLSFVIKGDTEVQKTIPAPVTQYGRLNVTSRKSGSSVYIDGKEVGYTPWTNDIPVGNHNVYVLKSKYKPSKTQSVFVGKGQNTKLEFSQKKDYAQTWFFSEEDFCNHFFEGYYGIDMKKRNYVGANYGYVSHHLGAHVTGMYGIDTEDGMLAVGPLFRLTDDYKALDLQLYGGVGAAYFKSKDDYKFGVAGDLGLRFAFNNESKMSWWSFSLACKYYNRNFIPSFGISLMPVGLLSFLADTDDEDDFPCYYFEVLAGYSTAYKSKGADDAVMLGGTYGWIRSHLGVYGTFLYGLDNSVAMTAGPVIRLTNDDYKLDLQLYGGIGWGHYSRDYSKSVYVPGGYYDGYWTTKTGTKKEDKFAGDFGLRFGFKNSGYSRFAWWSFTTGCMMYGSQIVPTVGMSLGIAGVAALVGATAVGIAYGVEEGGSSSY